jgi:hypothetical protein
VIVSWAVLRRFSVNCVAAALLCVTAMGNDSGQPVSDEALRLAALRAIFPGMSVSLDRSKRIDDSWPEKPNTGELYFPDALAGESVYEVTGGAMNEAESEASKNIITGKSFNTRQVRFKLFRWPNENDSGLLAILQYDFPDASPAMSCPSIGLLVHLIKNAADWAVKEQYLLETVHHHSLQGIRLLDLTGVGANQLVIESNSGGAGTAGSNLLVFDLTNGRLDEVLDTESRMQYMTDDWYTQTLDLSRTREGHGQRFCFSKTTLFEAGKAFRPPRVTRPCYKRGDGVDPAEVRQRNRMLTPAR